MELLATLEAEGLVPDDAVCVAVVGSQSRGWQHARSDLDVVVVITSPLPAEIDNGDRDEHKVVQRVTWAGGERCEVKYWSQERIRAAVDKLGWAEWDAGRAAGSLSRSESLLVERLPHAIALRGEPWLAAVGDDLRSGAVFSCFSLAALAYADRSLEDVSGLWESGDFHGAVLAAQRAFIHVTDALTASLSVPGTASKWRLRRVQAVATDVLGPDEFWRISTMRDFDPDRPEVWLDHVTHRCAQIMLDVRIGR